MDSIIDSKKNPNKIKKGDICEPDFSNHKTSNGWILRRLEEVEILSLHKASNSHKIRATVKLISGRFMKRIDGDLVTHTGPKAIIFADSLKPSTNQLNEITFSLINGPYV